MKIGMQFTGLAEMLANVKGISEKVKRQIGRKAMGKAGRPMLKAMKALTPEKTGLTRELLAMKVKTYRKSGAAVAVLGPKAKAGEKRAVLVRFKPAGQEEVVSFIKQTYRQPSLTFHLIENAVRPHTLKGGSKLAKVGKKGVDRQWGARHPGFKGLHILAKVLASGSTRALATVREVIIRELALLAK